MTTYEYQWKRLTWPKRKADPRSRFEIEAEFMTEMGQQGWRMIDRSYYSDSVDVLFERKSSE